MSKFIYHLDPGHGWLEVKRRMLEDLGILNEITRYSYENTDKVYLEEDLDMGKFLAAYVNKFGEEPEIVEVYIENTPIRGFDPFWP